MQQGPRSDPAAGPGGPFGPRHPHAAPTPAPDEVPEVADALDARAHGLRRVAEQIDATVDGGLARALRAHAGDVDALAHHLRDTGADTAGTPATPATSS